MSRTHVAPAGRTAAWPDAVVLGLAAVLAGLPLLPVFGARSALPVLVAGAVLGAVLAAVAARRDWGAMVTLAAAVGAYLLLGPALAAPTLATGRTLPTLESTSALLRAVVTVWKEVLTLDPELGASGHVLAAPYLLGLLCAGAAVSVAARASRGTGAPSSPERASPCRRRCRRSCRRTWSW